MSPCGPFDIAVAGCGPAGLAVAILLKRAGHRVTVFERFVEPRPVGSGLMLQPTGMAVLQRIGLAGDIAARGARIDALLGLTETNRVALDARYAELGLADAFGIGIHRASLFDALFAAAASERIEIRTGHEIVGSSLDGGGGRSLTFRDGKSSERFDLVVDATGWHSELCREAVTPLPFGALWAVLPVRAGDPHNPAFLEQRYRGARQMVGLLPIGSRGVGKPQEIAFFWSLKVSDYTRWCAASLDAWKQEVLDLWPEIGGIVDRIDHRDQLTFARYAHRSSAHAQADRLFRIGDAWHSASPQLGQGANMALLDAWALARGLACGRTLDEGMRWADGWRRGHVQLYQWITAMFTPLYQSDASFPPLIRDRLLAPLSRLWPVTRLQAQLMSGLFGSPLAILGLDPPDYPAIASSMAERASSLDQS